MAETQKNERSEIISLLESRFPVLNRLKGCFGCCLEEDIPSFLSLILCLAEKEVKDACCLVFPEATRIAQLSAVLLSLVRLQRDFQVLLNRYAETGFRRGQNVAVLPKRYVYTYEGFWPDQQGFFRLGCISQAKTAKGSRTFPIDWIVRLEQTDKKRPMGKLNTKLSEPEIPLIDKLIDIKSYGNTSIYETSIILLGSKTDFKNMLSETFLFPRNKEDLYAPLEDFFPWGDIDDDCRMNLLGPKLDNGNPLVAVSLDCEKIAAACENAKPFSKTIIACSPAGLVNNIQCYDMISERQHLIVMANRNQIESLTDLHDRGAVVWGLTPDEMLLGNEYPEKTLKSSYLGNILLCADNLQNRQLTRAHPKKN